MTRSFRVLARAKFLMKAAASSPHLPPTSIANLPGGRAGLSFFFVSACEPFGMVTSCFRYRQEVQLKVPHYNTKFPNHASLRMLCTFHVGRVEQFSKPSTKIFFGATIASITVSVKLFAAMLTSMVAFVAGHHKTCVRDLRQAAWKQ